MRVAQLPKWFCWVKDTRARTVLEQPIVVRKMQKEKGTTGE